MPGLLMHSGIEVDLFYYISLSLNYSQCFPAEKKLGQINSITERYLHIYPLFFIYVRKERLSQYWRSWIPVKSSNSCTIESASQ